MTTGDTAAARIAIDVTQFYHNPARSGVQRVVRELLHRWPSNGAPPTIVRFEAGQGLLQFPPNAVALMTETDPDAPGMSHAELRARLHGSTLQPLGDARGMPVLIPEVFYDPVRCQFHEDRLAAAPGSLAMLLYDFLPLLHSDLFSFANTLTFMPYTRLVRRAPHVAFISGQTRHEYATRIMHRGRCTARELARIGPVLSPGADGLGVERQVWSPHRRGFAALGSIDGRKNQDLIVAAFMRLWDAGHDMPLTLIGHSYVGAVPDWLQAASRSPHFSWLPRATDAEVAAVLRVSRATIFASDVEGYGLPPVESLAAGIPVIAAAGLPSLSMLPPAGQIRLAAVTAKAIADAVLAIVPDAAARRLWTAAATLRLDSWQDFADQMAAWSHRAFATPTAASAVSAGPDRTERPSRRHNGGRLAMIGGNGSSRHTSQ